MSKEEYLKGEDKEKALDIIKIGIAVRMRNSEILEQLKKKDIEISERTLRRYKEEIIKTDKNSAFEIYQTEIGSRLVEDILSYKEMERRCWSVIFDSSDNKEKLRAMSVLRGVSSDKLNLLKRYPRARFGLTCDRPFDKKKDLNLNQTLKKRLTN